MPQFSRGWSPLPTSSSGSRPTQIGGPPSGGGGWTFLCGGDANPTGGTNQTSVIYQVSNGGILTGFAPHGLYPTRDAAQAAMDTLCGGAPQQPPTPPPPTTPTSPTLYFYIVCMPKYGTLTAPSAVVSYIIEAASQDNALSIAQSIFAKDGYPPRPDYTPVVTGPFATRAIAESAQSQVEDSCLDTFSAKTAKPCNYKPLIACPPIPPELTGLGTPGTAEWCKALDVVVGELGAAGNAIFLFVDDLLNSKTRIDNIDEYIKTGGASSVVKGIVQLIRQVFCWLAPYIETVRQGITCLRQWLAALFPRCNSSAVFGLSVVRGVLVTFERFEWGSDAALWAVATSGISINPLMTVVDYLIEYACPQRIPGEAETVEAYKYNIISEDLAKCILQAHGLQWQTALPGIIARGDKPGWREAMQYVRRLNGNPDDEDATLRNLGVLDSSYRDLLKTVYDELPTISDHLEFLRKNVFDDQYVKDFRLMEGFEDRFWAKFGGQLRALGMTKETAGLHYAAHWINPSFQQQFSMVQRLRPGRVQANLQFTRSDLLRTMQEMDVGAFFRERLEAVSHPVPNLTLCLQMYQFGTVDDGEFIEKLKDLGFDDTNATAILDAQRIKVRRLNASSGHGWTPAALAQGFAIGKLTDQQIDDEMRYLGYSQSDADRLKRRSEIELAAAPVRRLMQSSIRSALTTQSNAYRCGAIDAAQLRAAYRSAGIPDNVAQVGVSDVDASVAVDICRKQVASFRSALLRGKVNVDQLRGIMTGAGMPQLRVEQLLKSWVIEAGLRAPQATAAQILRWVGQGLLDRETASLRLVNLGWTDPDLALLLAESLSKAAAAQTRIQAQAARSQQAAARAAMRAATEAEKSAAQLRSKLKGIASRSALQKWYKEGLIDDTYFVDAMKARGFDDDSTLKYLEESQLARLKAAKPPQSKPPKGAQSNGTPAGG